MAVMGNEDLTQAMTSLGRFMDQAPLTESIAGLEASMDGRQGAGVADVVRDSGLDKTLFAATLTVRAAVGRLNDIIHAAGISLALPELLEPGETIVNRPSLAAGNDPSRPYDVETDRRVFEFKLSVWTGADAMRKRQTFKDFVTLAADESDRRGCLCVVGDRPVRFLRGTTSVAGWGLDRSPSTRDLFADRFGSLNQPIGEFVARHPEVEIVDLTAAVPDVFGAMA